MPVIQLYLGSATRRSRASTSRQSSCHSRRSASGNSMRHSQSNENWPSLRLVSVERSDELVNLIHGNVREPYVVKVGGLQVVGRKLEEIIEFSMEIWVRHILFQRGQALVLDVAER